ncbi:hypothetical protein NLI96_g5381 [Meripilus lineatus]|uniref:F-box domain-containing protein n=1 Tax=Meripilus lineatus TaxID=2056292 RepID=A0AAD5V8E7_9APHY|nr:hypothetical protein NLI96_g5381 [Physisporinus lineatus]
MCIPRTKQPALLVGNPSPPLEDVIKTPRSLTTHLQSGNSTPSRCQLPLELIEAILFHLRHRKAALKSCSLVSRNWTHYCRQHLFRQVTFDWDRKDSPRGNSESSRFLALLDDSPIGHFIQILFITSSPFSTAPRSHVDITTESFARLLSRLENLKFLHIRSFQIRLEPQAEKDPLVLQMSYHRSLDNLVIDDLTISDPSFNYNECSPIATYPFLRFLHLFGQISSLSLGRCFYKGRPLSKANAILSPPPKFKIPTLKLTTGLEMNFSSNSVKAFLECIDLHQLESFHVAQAHSQNIGLTNYIVERSPNLTNVSLNLPDFLFMQEDRYYWRNEYVDDWNWNGSPLFSLRQLESITSGIHLIGDNEGDYHNKWVQTILKSLLREMKRIDHEFILELSVLLEKGPSAVNLLNWSDIRYRMEELPMLTKMSLRINVSGLGGSQAVDPDLYDIPRRDLLALRERCGVELDIP